jgi:hypothetical protein
MKYLGISSAVSNTAKIGGRAPLSRDQMRYVQFAENALSIAHPTATICDICITTV